MAKKFPIKIKNPPVISANGSTGSLKWSPNTSDMMQRRFSVAQKMLDSEIVKYTSPFVPMDNGILMESAQIATDYGSGEVIWQTPYARHQYYKTDDTRTYDPLRGGHWFDRAKAVHGSRWVKMAKQVFRR